MKHKLVIFDLDGTLLDTLDDLSAAVNHAMQLRGFPQHTRDEYMKMVGHGARNLMRQALPEGHKDDDMVETAYNDFKAYYTDHIDVHTKPFPGIQELMATLHHEGVLMAVASNKFQEGARRLIRHFYPQIPEERVLGEVEGRPRKPDPAMIEAVMSSFPKGTRCCVVGDAWTDIEAGKAYGCDTIGVSWGYRYTEALYKAGADKVVDTVDALKAILLQTL